MPSDQPTGTSFSLHDSFVLAEDVTFRELDGEAVLLHMGIGVYFGLDPVGTRMWQLIAEHGQLAAVHERLLAEYEIDSETVANDLLDLVLRLTSRGLLKRSG